MLISDKLYERYPKGPRNRPSRLLSKGAKDKKNTLIDRTKQKTTVNQKLTSS